MSRHKKIHIGLYVTIACAVIVWAEAAMAARKAARPPCAQDLQSCPERGCAERGTSEALVNQVKRTWPPSKLPVVLTFGDFEALQGQADALVGQGVSLSDEKRRKMRGLKHAGREVGEGALVQVVGYVVGPPRNERSGESVNCRISGATNSDFRMAIAEEPEASEFDGIEVVMIPQWRPRGWTLEKLGRVLKERRPVLVRGQLFYDSEHRVNDDPEEEIPGQPRRFSLWEVHPVTDVYVCVKEDRVCNAQDLGAWERLELAFTRTQDTGHGLQQEKVEEQEIKESP